MGRFRQALSKHGKRKTERRRYIAIRVRLDLVQGRLGKHGEGRALPLQGGGKEGSQGRKRKRAGRTQGARVGRGG